MSKKESEKGWHQNCSADSAFKYWGARPLYKVVICQGLCATKSPSQPILCYNCAVVFERRSIAQCMSTIFPRCLSKALNRLPTASSIRYFRQRGANVSGCTRLVSQINVSCTASRQTSVHATAASQQEIEEKQQADGYFKVLLFRIRSSEWPNNIVSRFCS